MSNRKIYSRVLGKTTRTKHRERQKGDLRVLPRAAMRAPCPGPSPTCMNWDTPDSTALTTATDGKGNALTGNNVSLPTVRVLDGLCGLGGQSIAEVRDQE